MIVKISVSMVWLKLVQISPLGEIVSQKVLQVGSEMVPIKGIKEEVSCLEILQVVMGVLVSQNR